MLLKLLELCSIFLLYTFCLNFSTYFFKEKNLIKSMIRCFLKLRGENKLSMVKSKKNRDKVPYLGFFY